jgi:hypothetical protein
MRLRLGILGIGLLVCSVSAQALAADVVINDDARAHFAAGVNLLQDPDGARYEEAYAEFKTAYAASPSWKILGNLGISAMKLERDGEAIEAYKKYLSEGGKQIEAGERAQFQRDLATLEAGVVRLTLDSDPPGARIEDERFPASRNAIRNEYAVNGVAQIGVHAGRHRFTAKLPGHADAVWEVTLSPRQQESHSFKLTEIVAPAPAAAPPPAAAPAPAIAPVDTTRAKGTNGVRIGAYVALGIGVVGLGAGTIFGLSAKSKYAQANDITNDSESCPPSGPCELSAPLFDERQQLGKNGDSAKTLSLVGFIVGGVGVATGVTLFVLSNKKEPPAAAKVEPYLGIGHLGVRGSF